VRPEPDDVEQGVLLVGRQVRGVALGKDKERLVPEDGQLVALALEARLLVVGESGRRAGVNVSSGTIDRQRAARRGRPDRMKWKTRASTTLYGSAYFLSRRTRIKSEWGPV
jgi:hypothetical protein